MTRTRFFKFSLSVAAALTLVVGLTGCFYKPPIDMPDPSVISIENGVAVPPDCVALARKSGVRDGDFKRRPSMAWGCATYTNLAAQVANPEDLEAPAELGPANAAVAASAVHRYETGHVTPLDQGTSRDSK